MTESQQRVFHVAIIVLIVAAGLYVLTVTNYTPGLSLQTQKVDSVHSELIVLAQPADNLTSDDRGRILYGLQDGRWGSIETPASAILIDYTRTPNRTTEAFLLKPEELLATQVSLRTSAGETILLGDRTTIKNDITVSPDASFVAYAELTEPIQSTLYTTDVSKWNVVVVDVASKRPITLGAGVAPYFLGTSRIVAYSSFEGLVIYSLETGEREVLGEFAVTDLEAAIQISPSGDYFAVLNERTGKYTIFELHQTRSFSFSALGGLRHEYERIVLTNVGMLGLSHIDGEWRIFTTSFENIHNNGFREEMVVLPGAINPIEITL